MNKSGDQNRSVRNTKRKLKEALLTLMKEKSINEITAKELAEMTDLNRGTFYFHYSDVYDLLEKIEDEFFRDFDKMVKDIPSEQDMKQRFTAILVYIRENRDFCRIMLGKNGDVSFLRRIRKLVEEVCCRSWREKFAAVDAHKESMYNAFIIYGFLGVVQRWLDDGTEDTPERLSEIAETIITSSVDKCLLGECNHNRSSDLRTVKKPKESC